MVCSGHSMTSFQAGPRRVIFPMLHRNDEATGTPDISDLSSSFLKTPASCPQHARRGNHSCLGILGTSSIESDMPSLGSLSSNSEQGTMSVGSTSDDSFSVRHTNSSSRSCQLNSKKGLVDGKGVRFDPRVWVHEFQRSHSDKKSAWFTANELSKFKSIAIQCIIAYNSNALRKAGNDEFQNQGGSGKVLYSHPALGADGEYDPILSYQNRDVDKSAATVSQLRINQFRDAVAETEVRNILIVNSHDAFLNLFAKGMRKIFPCATITTARTRENALMLIEERRSKQKAESNRYDVVVVDEKLKRKNWQEVYDESAAGASFLFDITKVSGRLNAPMKTLFVGVCSDFNAGNLKLKANGADLVWQKPPPLMDERLRDTILRALLTKRGRISIVKKLF